MAQRKVLELQQQQSVEVVTSQTVPEMPPMK
jgi:hypothetical protein